MQNNNKSLTGPCVSLSKESNVEFEIRSSLIILVEDLLSAEGSKKDIS